MYGKEIKENLLEVNYESDNIKVTGVVGNTMISRDNRKEQILFLNKRNIKNNVLINSADQAFKGGVGIGKYGFYILNLDMPADFYDVNVHPTKMEVRFKDEDKIYKVLYHAMKSTMLKFEFLGNNENEEHNEEYIQNEYEFLTNEFSEKKEEKYLDLKIENQFINNVTADKNQNIELRKREESRTVKYKYIGILFRTFIIIEVENELFLIDQHAAHERVLYEKIKENYKQKISQNSQMMLVPEVINLTHKEMEFVKNNIEMFVNTGFDIEIFGENSIKINGIPDLEYKAKTQNIFMDILDEMLTNERTSIKDIEERFIATVACKAAVKANMDLSKPEVENLIQSLLSLNNPYTCPHGRPTTIKISRDFIKNKLSIN